MNDLSSAPSLYASYLDEEVRNGEAAAEERFFPRHRERAPMPPYNPVAHHWTGAFMDCVIERRDYRLLSASPHYIAPVTIASAWRDAVASAPLTIQDSANG